MPIEGSDADKVNHVSICARRVILILIREDNRRYRPVECSMCHEFAQHARLRITLYNDDTVVLLVSNRHTRAVLIHRELARKETSAGDLDLQLLEVAGGSVNLVVADGVRDQLRRVLRIKVGDAEAAFVARCDKQELVVGLRKTGLALCLLR